MSETREVTEDDLAMIFAIILKANAKAIPQIRGVKNSFIREEQLDAFAAYLAKNLRRHARLFKHQPSPPHSTSSPASGERRD